MNKVKVKKNDKVAVIKGKDKGKTGKVLNVNLDERRVLVEGVNLKKKHRRPKKTGEKGQIITIPAPLSIANVKVICSHCGKASRIGKRKEGDKNVRYCKKCDETI